MADFGKNLQPIIKDQSIPSYNSKLPSPINTSEDIQTDDVFQRINALSSKGNTAEKGIFVTDAQVEANKRFGGFNPTIPDMEDYASYGQSSLSKATNGILKGVNLAATTVVGGFAMLGGIPLSMHTGKLSSIWDNEVMRMLDKYNEKLDNEYLPNYYSRKERDAKWYSTDNWLTFNFIFDKLIKNAGFAAGAMVGGNIANTGLLKLGQVLGKGTAALAGASEASQAFKIFTPILRNTSRAFSAAKNAEAAAILEGELSTIADVAAKSSQLAKLASTQLSYAKFGDQARRIAVAAYSSGGEASFEALQTSNEYRKSLIENFRNEYGRDPNASEMDSIDNEVAKVGKTSFLGNMALLGVTEWTQLPYLLGSSYKNTRQVANSIAGKAGEVILKDGKYITKPAATTKFGKMFNLASKTKYVFDPKEAGQEIGQYALQIGSQNYFNKARETNNANMWVDGFLYGMFGEDERGKKVGALVSKEGIESGILGGITGGLMQTLGKVKEFKAEKNNTQIFLNSLNNAPTFRDAFKERLDSANRGIVLQQQERDATINGDELEAKDLKTDSIHNYLAPRIKFGRFDMVMEDIEELKRDSSTEEGLANIKAAGQANTNDTIQTYHARLNKLQDFASTINKLYESYNLRYSGEVVKNKDGDVVLDENKRPKRKYSSIVIDKMVYAATKIHDYDVRIPSIAARLISEEIDTTDVLSSIIKENKPNKEATQKALEKINSLDVSSDIKDGLKKDLQDVIELSLRRKLFIDELSEMKDNPSTYQQELDDFFGEEEELPVEVVQKQGDKKVLAKIRVGDEYSLEQGIMRNDNSLFLSPKISVISQTLGGEYEVKLPTGKVVFLTPEQFEKYNISAIDNSGKKISEILDNAIKNVISRKEYSDIKVPDTNKLAYINSLNNKQLIDAIEEEFGKNFEKYKAEEFQKELKKKKLIENKNKIFDDLSKKDVKAGNPVYIIKKDENVIEVESLLKDANILFVSTTTESEDYVDTTLSAPHITRSRIFLNNAKKFKNRSNLRAIVLTPNRVSKYNLNGLIQMSYERDINDSIDSIEDVKDKQKGFVAALFVEKIGDKYFFINEKGEHIKNAQGEDVALGETVDLNQIVFQTMPTTSLNYTRKTVSHPEGTPRYRKDQEELATAKQKAWIEKRKSLFASDEIIESKFSISRGIPRVDYNNKNHIVGTLISEEDITKGGILIIPTTDTVFHAETNENIKCKQGIVVLENADTLHALHNNKLGEKKANTVYAVINALTKQLLQDNTVNDAYYTYLTNVLFCTKTGPAKENKFYINTSTAEISIGTNTYSILDIEDKKDEIINVLKDTYHNINNFSLKDAGNKFIEYDENLVPHTWTNYQEYLLSTKNFDNTNRTPEESPLFTYVQKPTEGVPTAFKQKYAILNEVELPFVEIKPTQKPPQKPVEPEKKIGAFDVSGNVVNTYIDPATGTKINFKAIINDEGKPKAFPENNDALIDAISKDEVKYTAITKALVIDDPEEVNDDRSVTINNFLAHKMEGILISLRNEGSKPPTPPPPPPSAPEEPADEGGYPDEDVPFSEARNTIDPEIRNKYFKDGNTTTDKEVLEKISKSIHPLAPLAKHLLKFAKGTEIQLIASDNVGVTKNGKPAAAAAYPLWIEIAEFARFAGLGVEPALLHEILHTYTKNYIDGLDENSKEYSELNRLYQEAKSQIKDYQYGLTDIHEFFVALFTDSDLIRDLRRLPSSKPTTFKNLLQEIFDYILSLFGIKQDSSLYSDAFAVATNILQSAVEEEMAFREGGIQQEAVIKEGVSELFESNPELANAVYKALGFKPELQYIVSKHDTNDDVLIKDKIVVTKELQNIKGNNFDGSINMDYKIIRERANKVNIGDTIDISDLIKPREVTIDDVLKRFTISDENKYLLEKLTPVLKNIKIEYITKNIFGNGVGMYSDKYNTIRLLDINSIPRHERPKISEQEVFFHELLHAATFRKISYFETNTKGLSAKELAALNELENIRKILKEYGKESLISTKKREIISNPLYGYTTDSVHEIISYAFTNKEFRDAIAEIPYIEKKSILDKVIELIANIFGVKQNTVLSALLANTEILLEDTKITPQQKQKAQIIYSQYLDTIFPDSKMKEIVYHGSEFSNIEKFNKDKLLSGEGVMAFGKGFYFTQNPISASYHHDIVIRGIYSFDSFDEGEQLLVRDEVKRRIKGEIPDFKGKVYSVILNIKNPVYWENTSKERKSELKNGEYINNDSVIHEAKGYTKLVGNQKKFEDLQFELHENERALRDGNFGAPDDLVTPEMRIELLNRNKEIEKELSKYNKFIQGETHYIVPEPEQIHILGSKQDVEGFKKWINEPSFAEAASLSEKEIAAYVDDVFIRTSQIIFLQDLKGLFNLYRITSKEVFNKIKEQYSSPRELKYQKIGEENWKIIVERTLQKLNTIGITFNKDDVATINEEDANSRNYAAEAFSVDFKKYSPYSLKLMLSTIVKTEPLIQENTKGVKMPKIDFTDSGSIKGYVSVNFSKVFSTLINKLHNATNVKQLEKALDELMRANSEYVRVFTRLGGNIETGNINYDEFSNEQWRLFIQFYQTFTKQKPDILVQYYDGRNAYTGRADLFGKTEKIKREWINELKTRAKDPSSFITWDSVKKIYKFKKTDKFPTSTPKTSEDAIKFLNDIGIVFSDAIFNKLAETKGKRGGKSERERFFDAVSGIYKYLQNAEDIVTMSDKTLNIAGHFNTISELFVKVTNPTQDSTRFNLEGNRVQNFADNNVPSIFENDFNGVSTLDELKEVRPELNDVFSTNSVKLKPGGLFFDKNKNRTDRNIKVTVIDGKNDLVNDKGTSIGKLNLGDRLVVEINQNAKGNYYILLNADGSVEWVFSLGNEITMSELSDPNYAWNNIYEIFNGYLEDDFLLALDHKTRSSLKAISDDRAKELRFFNEILSQPLLDGINKMVNEHASIDEFRKYINNNRDAINRDIKSFIEYINAGTKQLLFETKKITYNVNNDSYTFPELSDELADSAGIDKFNIPSKELDRILTFLNANYSINGIELHKLIFGDPYQFEITGGNLDETKRAKSFLSPRRVTFDHVSYNNFLNKEYNTVEGNLLKDGELGKHNFRSFVRTVTLDEVKINTINYDGVKEADGASFMMDNAYREVKLKNAQWSDKAEEWHQWHMAYTRQHLPGYIYKDESLKQRDAKLISTPEPDHVIEILKPIVSGVKNGVIYIDLVLDKFSQMPVYYKAIEGTSLADLYEKMWKEDIGYVIMASGRKVGTKKTHPLYDANNNFNTAPFDKDAIVEVPWKIYGIQVETSYDKPHEQTQGSQITKMASVDLYEYGKPISSQAEKAYLRNVEALRKLHENAYTELLERLGIEDLGGSYKLVNPEAIEETLAGELMRRELSQNAIETLKRDENGEFKIPFEASTHYQQIKDILFSIVDKTIVSKKMHGGPKIQAPQTLWEKSGKGRRTVTINDKTVYTDDTLKFYTKDAPYCEIMLPHWFREKFNKSKYNTDEALLKYLNTKEGIKILSGIGFRIPTQSMGSIEVFRVKGFLPQFMGDTVIVPSEIVAKAGSDFDVDKLNTYLKGIYVDEHGDIKLATLKGNEEETKQFYSDVYTKVTNNELNRITNKKEFKERIFNILNKMEYLPEDRLRNVDSIAGLTSEDLTFYKKYAKIIDTLIEEADNLDILPSEYLRQQIERVAETEMDLAVKLLDNSLRDIFVKKMYKRALENEYYDSLEEMITIPENFERLLTPVDDAGLKDLARRMDILRGSDETKIKNRIINRNYITNLRNEFLLAKKWVGIAAVNITGLSITQKANVYLDPSRINALSDFEKRILGDGLVKLPHNKVMVDGEEYLSLSGIKTHDEKEYISGRLSGYITSFVDVAKDPYIIKLLPSDNSIGVSMFLERIGAGETGVLFTNQPIIREYLLMLNSKGAKGLLGRENIDAILNKFGGATITKVGGFNIDNFEKNIQDYYKKQEFTDDGVAIPKLTDAQLAEQQAIFFEFLKYAKMAEYSFKLTQATNFDTTKFRNSETFHKKQKKEEFAVEKNIFVGIDDILNNTFLGYQMEVLGDGVSSLGAVLKLEQNELRAITEDVMSPFDNVEFITADNFNKISSKLKASFLDYIIQTKGGFNNKIKELLVTPSTSVVKQLEEAKKKHPKLEILQHLKLVPTRENEEISLKSIELDVNLKNAYDENLFTGMMRELREAEPMLYDNIVTLSILQGTYQSAVSIKNIIPIEDYSKKIKPIIDTLVVNNDIRAYQKGYWFQRNNWKDENIVPIYSPKMDERNPDYEMIGGEEETSYEVFGFRTSKLLKSLNLPEETKFKSRQILLINETYNANIVKYDVIKVPRLISTSYSEKVDMVTGRVVTSKMIRDRLVKGDYSYFATFGYQQVKYENGNPVKTFKGEHIYKLINLYGDGQYGHPEYYKEFKPSAYENNTIKVMKEIDNTEIIKFYGEEYIAPEAPKLLMEVRKELKSGTIEQKDIIDIDKETLTELLKMPYKGYENALWYYFVEKAKLVDPSKANSIMNAKDYHTAYLIGSRIPNTPESEILLNNIINDLRKEKIEQKEFIQFGTQYRFNIKNGIPISGEYKQAGKEWNPLNPKNVVSKYEELTSKNIEKETKGKKKTIFDLRSTPLSYTDGQVKALNDIQKLIDTNKQGYYLLAGYAGTGKTTIAENIAKYAVENGRTVVVLAPTNKAVKVLNDKFAATEVKSDPMTIHRAIYGEPDATTGDWIPKSIIKNSVVIIDESSMISKDVMRDLIDNTKNNNILIFMGDRFQLEPVEEDAGLFKGNVEEVKDSTELTEVKRQTLDSNVLKVATLVRTDNKAYIPSESVNNFKSTTSRKEFIDDYRSSIRNNEDSIMIVATNAERMSMNTIARDERFGSNRKILEEGETLISVANSSGYPNSEILKVNSIVSEPNEYNLKFQFKDKIVDYKVNITDITDEQGIPRRLYLFAGLDRPSLYHSQILTAIKEYNPTLFDILESEGDIFRTNKGKPKLNPRVVIATYGYAITAHKSQGSQWQKVFVNQNYVAPSWNSARWWYTAITRSSNDVIALASSNNTKITPSSIEERVSNMVIPDTIIEGGTNKKTIMDYYNSLSLDQKTKLGSLETLMEEYNNIPFEYTEEEFIEQLKCRL